MTATEEIRARGGTSFAVPVAIERYAPPGVTDAGFREVK